METTSPKDKVLPNEIRRQLGRLVALHDYQGTVWDFDENLAPPSTMYAVDRMGTETFNGPKIAERAVDAHTLSLDSIVVGKDTAEKSRALRAIHDVIVGEAEDKEGVGWNELAFGLLKRSGELVGDEKTACIVGAVACTQFAVSQADREDFLREVYRDGRQAEVAQACKDSSLVLLIEDSESEDRIKGVHSIHGFAAAFEFGPDEIHEFLDDPRGVADDHISPKKLQKTIFEQASAGTIISETQHQAEKASVNGEQVDRLIMDPLKIERFAIQQYYIDQQMNALFPKGVSFENSPFVQKLAAMRAQNNTLGPADLGDITRLTVAEVAQRLDSDIMQAVRDLSQTVTARFMPPEGAILATPGLSEEQRAALRFREVIVKMGRNERLAKYLDYKAFITKLGNESPVDGRPKEVWEISEEGAAVPAVCNTMLTNIVMAALLSSEHLSPEGLRDLAQSDRRRFLALATVHIRALPLDRVGTEQVNIQRDAAGILRFEGASVLGKNASDYYSAIALGCPALRVIHGDRRLLDIQQRLAHGSSNYIDHILAAA
ncbi:MAG TPA: hypothetical protein VNX65_02490, partial [Patescibacteria group bacterium]|nr:hypothetical protein [Patescibacteria group bacterium]